MSTRVSSRAPAPRRSRRPPSDNVATDVRAVVRVLLRGLPEGRSGERRIEGHSVLLVGAPDPAQWPNERLAAGDMVGVVWTTPAQAQAVRQRMRKNACVLSAFTEIPEPELLRGPTAPPPRRSTPPR